MKIISGGQTGVDRMGLEIAKSLGIQTGGTAPKGFYTDTGNDDSLKSFGVIESSVFGYSYRTECNVKDSDATVLFGNLSSPGCLLTIRLCKKHNKPYFKNPSADELFNKIVLFEVKTLNVAGNREKNLSESQKLHIQQTLTNALIMWRRLANKSLTN